jgi:hypothetical protein
MIDEKAMQIAREAIARKKEFDGANASAALVRSGAWDGQHEVMDAYRGAILAYESAKPKEAEGWQDIAERGVVVAEREASGREDDNEVILRLKRCLFQMQEAAKAETDRALSAEAKLAQAVEALNDILAANQRFREQMPTGWEGDPLQAACARAAAAMGEKT